MLSVLIQHFDEHDLSNKSVPPDIIGIRGIIVHALSPEAKAFYLALGLESSADVRLAVGAASGDLSLPFDPFPFDQKYRNSFKSKACGYKHPQTPPLSGKAFFPKLQTFGRL